MASEELLAKIKQLEEETAKLKEENARLQQQSLQQHQQFQNLEPATVSRDLNNNNSFPLVNRTPLIRILGRSDEGVGLIGKELCVSGWVRTLRVQGGGALAFIELYDGTIFQGFQIIVENENLNHKNFDQLVKDINTGCSIMVVGEVVKSPAKKQKVEFKAHEIVILGTADAAEYPLAKKQHTLEYLRTIGHLRPRTNTIGAVARVRNALAFATHDYFQKNGFIYVHTPLITASDCEGAGEMFAVTTLLSDSKNGKLPTLPDGKIDFSRDFFKKPSFLTVSGQLNGEMYACALASIYTFGPTFRAENSNTSRHLAEFWMIEPEIAFADLRENMRVAQGYIKHVLQYVMERCPQDLEFFEQMEKRNLTEKAKESKDKQAVLKDYKQTPLRERLRLVIDTPFAHVTYTDAVEMLQKSGVKFEEPCPKWGDDLKSEHERYLAEVVFKKPVIVTDYPRQLKAFYMRDNEDGKTVAAMDILVPGVGEIVGGSQREERLDVLEKKITTLGLDLKAYSGYLDLRRYGSVPHAGFGLGFERLVCYTTGLENIRDAIPFPRYPGHADF